MESRAPACSLAQPGQLQPLGSDAVDDLFLSVSPFHSVILPFK